MNIFNSLIFFSFLLLSQTSQAECYSDMPVQTLMDCVTIESTGEDYQQWKAAIEKQVKQKDNKKIIVDNNLDETKQALKPQ